MSRIGKLLVIVLMLLSAVGTWAQTPGTDAIRRENRIRTDSYTGDSVDAGTGAFVLSRTALSVQGIRTLDFNLNYNSMLTGTEGALGFGWSHDFEASVTGNPASIVTVNWDVNRRNDFRFVSSGAPYEALDEAVRYDRLTRQSDGTWRLIRLDGTQYLFTNTGRLSRIGNKVNQYINATFSDNTLREVSEPVANRRVALRYARDGSGLLQALVDGYPRVVFFSYDGSRRLRAVRPPVELEGNTYGPTFSPKSVPDNNPAGLTHTFTVGRSLPIGLVELNHANLTHSRPSDLTVTLISPQGTQAVIRNPVPSLTIGSPNPWDLAEMFLEEFEGENPQGTWRVVVVDSVPGSTGTLNAWSIRFTDPTDPTRYTYDSAGRITMATGPSGERLFANSYDSQGRVAAQDDGLDTNQIATFTYQPASFGIHTTYRDRTGRVHQFAHDDRYRLLAYSNPLGHTTNYLYDSSGNRIRVIDPLNRSTIFSYDADGNLTTVVDPASLTWTMTYDSEGNLQSFRDPLGKTTSFQYDGNNNLRRVTDALGHSDTKTYSGNSQMTGNLMSDGAGINYTYASGMPSGASHPAGGGNAGASHDAIGRATRLTDPDGNQTHSTYDAQSRVIAQTDGLGNTEHKEYDRRGRLSSRTDRRGNRTTFGYDNNDNVTSITDALGNVTRFEYDGEDRRVSKIDPMGNAEETVYDIAGRIITEIDASGLSTSFEYDAAGNLLAVKDANGKILEQNTYDSRDLQTSVTDALGNRASTAFDEVRRAIEIRDPLDRIQRWQYDSLDRLIQVQDPLGRTVRQTYEPDDVVRSITDARGNTVTFYYDSANRLTSVEEPVGRPRRYTYNGRDLIVRDTQPGGERQQDYTYDAGGRLTSVRYTNLRNTSESATTSYAYDNSGNRTEVRRATGTQTPVLRLTRGYDPLNRISRYTDGLGNTLFYAYDAAGNLKELTYPDGKKVTYSYDPAGRMTSVTDWAQRVTRYTYDENGRMTQTILPNGTVRLMAYDAVGRIVSRRDFASDGAVIVEYKYSYDAAGQLVNESGTHATAPNLTPSTVMAYDNANKLTSVDTQNVVHDEDGNLTDFKGNVYRYNLNGNLRLANNVTYTYDEEDRLISFVSSGGTTSFVVNPAAALSQVLVRRSPNGAITRYVYGAGLLYEEMSNGQTRTYHFDARGSTAGLADAGGVIAARVAYGPYGELLTPAQAIDSPFLYNGLFGVITDPNGLNYMRFRWYSPELKRFLNRDAHFGDITSIDSLNRFAFVGDSPMMRVDPEGQFWWVAAGALVGAVAAVAVKAASDLITGKFSGWQAYAGAAVGGAVTGALFAACPACGIAGQAAIGAVGGAAAYLTEKGLRGQKVDAEELALEALGGAAAGGIGGGAGKLSAKLGGKAASSIAGKLGGKLANRLGRAAARQGVYGRGALIKGALARETPVGFFKGLVGAATSEVLTRTGAASVLDRFIFGVGSPLGFLVSQTHGTEAETAREGIHSEARLNLNRNRKSAFGEFIHWQFWLDNLQLAARPIPNNPNNLLTSF